MAKNKAERRLRKISHWSAWAVLAGVIVLVVSGWGITHTEIIYQASFGLINRKAADTIHRLSNAPVAALLLIHVLAGAKLSLSSRYPTKAWLVNLVLVTIGAGLMALVLYLEFLA